MPRLATIFLVLAVLPVAAAGQLIPSTEIDVKKICEECKCCIEYPLLANKIRPKQPTILPADIARIFENSIRASKFTDSELRILLKYLRSVGLGDFCRKCKCCVPTAAGRHVVPERMDRPANMGKYFIHRK